MNTRVTTMAFVTACAVLVASLSAPLSGATSTVSLVTHPSAIALGRSGHVWVTNSGKHGVTELDATTGKLVRIVDGETDGFNDPTGIAVDGNHVWVTNGGVDFAKGTSNGHSVTELDATTGSLLGVVNLKKRGLSGLSGVSADGNHVWVVADGGERVAELSNSTGSVLHVYRSGNGLVGSCSVDTFGAHVWLVSPSSSKGGVIERANSTGAWERNINIKVLERSPGISYKVPTFLGPLYVAEVADHLWIANSGGTSLKLGGGSVSELDATNGHVIRLVDTRADAFESIRGLVADDRHVWVLNGTVGTAQGKQGDSVSELRASNGDLVRTIPLRGHFSEPWGIAENDRDVWIADAGGGSEGEGAVVELDETTGAIVRTVS